MLRIPCPYCGPRDETEFAFGGEAHLDRPPLASTDEEWTAYLFLRTNPSARTPSAGGTPAAAASGSTCGVTP